MLKVGVGQRQKRENQPTNQPTQRILPWTETVRLTKCCLTSGAGGPCPIWAPDQPLCGGHVLHQLSGVSFLLEEEVQVGGAQRNKSSFSYGPKAWILGSCLETCFFSSCLTLAMLRPIKGGHTNSWLLLLSRFSVLPKHGTITNGFVRTKLAERLPHCCDFEKVTFECAEPLDSH